MTWTIFWRSAAAIGVLLTLGVYAAATSTFLFRHPTAPDARVVIDPRTGAAVVAALADPSSGITLTKPEPRLAAEEQEFNFGVMDPETSAKHDFVIHNTGTAELELKLGGTTCKCTISGVSDSRVAPGGTANVTMQWNTGRYNPHFEQSALIRTNDPLHKQVEFTVSGAIRSLVTLDRQEIALLPLAPDAAGDAEAVVYSQTWDDFEVTEVQSVLPQFTWTATDIVKPAAGLSAKAAKRLEFKFQGPATHGSFNDQVRITLRPRGEESDQIHHLYLELRGAVMRRLAFYGAAIDETGLIDLGDIPTGTSKRVKLLAKVRDPEPVIAQPRVEVFPSFLKATFTPRNGEKAGLYDLTVEVPDDVAACQYHSTPIGRVTIDTGHPRIGAVEMLVTFAVVPR